MMFWRDVEGDLLRYLLGELSEKRRARLEEKVLADERLFERLLIVEDELIDAYVRGELVADRRSRFEARYLSTPERSARIDVARGLKAAADAARPIDTSVIEAETSSPGIGWWTVLARTALPAAAAIALVVSLMTWRGPGPDGSDAGPPGVTATVVLLPSVRSEAAELPKLEWPGEAGIVELQVYVEDKGLYQSFLAGLETGRGEALWESGELPQPEADTGGRTVVVRPPADVFKAPSKGRPGVRHTLKLQGRDLENRTELIGEYDFLVVPAPDTGG